MEDAVRNYLQRAIDQKHIPGVVIQVRHQGEIVYKDALGWRIDYNSQQEKMMLDTIFDVASLTKVVATLPAVLKLVDQGKLELANPISNYLPKLNDISKEHITLTHLLTHAAGFRSHRKFYREELTAAEIIQAIYDEELIYPTGSRVEYSDLGFTLLGKIVESVSEQSFSDFVESEIFKPLGMVETGFNLNFSRARYAGTEYDEKIGTFKLGIVHDNNAEALGGVSGHAGLFSSLEDLGRFSEMVENDGVFRGEQIISTLLMKKARTNLTGFSKQARGLGWQLNMSENLSCGSGFSTASFGHTGFTGTSIWFDPVVDLSVILLTNRVHYGRGDAIHALRPEVHTLIRQHLITE